MDLGVAFPQTVQGNDFCGTQKQLAVLFRAKIFPLYPLDKRKPVAAVPAISGALVFEPAGQRVRLPQIRDGFPYNAVAVRAKTCYENPVYGNRGAKPIRGIAVLRV
jgi:hypothetical protein